MSTHEDVATRVERLRESYAPIGGSTPEQWDRLAALPADRPLTLINLFSLRAQAAYDDGEARAVTGQEAFDRYAQVSAPALDEVGGRFTHVGTHLGNLVGADETWDLVVIGTYPDLDALLALHENPAYREAYRHRVAACAEQRVLITA